MYSYLYAKLRKKGKNQSWETVNVSLVQMSILFNTYLDGYIALSNPTLSPTPIYVNFSLLKQANVPFYNLAFETWLATINDTVLPSYVNEPIYSRKGVLFSDAVQARFHVSACKVNDPYSTTGNQLTELSLHKDFIDYQLLKTSVLTSVNGLLHLNYGVDEHLIIKNGNLVKRGERALTVGMISFANIGTIEQIPITTPMLKSLSGSIPFRQAVLLDTGINLTGKSVMISIGGYLHAQDKIIDIVNSEEGLIRLNMEYLSLARRVFELGDSIDTTPLGLSISPNKTGCLAVAEIESDLFISRLLTLVQSFLIIVNNPYLTVRKVAVNKSHTFGIYEYGAEPLFPLVTPTGAINEYWLSNQQGVWVMSVKDNLYNDYSYETTEWKEDRVIKRHILPSGCSYAKASLLKIEGTIVTY